MYDIIANKGQTLSVSSDVKQNLMDTMLNCRFCTNYADKTEYIC